MTNQICDICGKTTYMNPQTQTIEIKDENNNIIGYEQTEILIQNANTGEMEKISVPKMLDLQERTYKVMLFSGSENIIRDFCKECLEKNEIGNKIRDLFNTLMNIKSK